MVRYRDYPEGVSKLTKVSAKGQVFVCGVCGNRVEVKEVGGGELVCCNRPMNLEE